MRAGAEALPAQVRVLSWLLLVTAVANAAVDLSALTLHLTGDVAGGGFGVAVRTVWGLLRSIGFLVLIWHLRVGRPGAWPFAIVLTVTTAFSAGRLAPLGGSPAQLALLAGFVLVALLCVAIVVLFRTPAVRAHLARRPPKRPAPTWAVTARVLVLSYTALLLVPCLVAVGTLFGDPRVGLAYAAPLVVGWLVLTLALNWLVPIVVFFLRRGHRWARAVALATSVLVLVLQPVLCLLLLGVDGLIRDGLPVVVAALLAIYGLAGDRSAREFFADRR